MARKAGRLQNGHVALDFNEAKFAGLLEGECYYIAQAAPGQVILVAATSESKGALQPTMTGNQHGAAAGREHGFGPVFITRPNSSYVFRIPEEALQTAGWKPDALVEVTAQQAKGVIVRGQAPKKSRR
jgi:hypothetical protein